MALRSRSGIGSGARGERDGADHVHRSRQLQPGRRRQPLARAQLAVSVRSALGGGQPRRAAGPRRAGAFSARSSAGAGPVGSLRRDRGRGGLAVRGVSCARTVRGDRRGRAGSAHGASPANAPRRSPARPRRDALARHPDRLSLGRGSSRLGVEPLASVRLPGPARVARRPSDGQAPRLRLARRAWRARRRRLRAAARGRPPCSARRQRPPRPVAPRPRARTRSWIVTRGLRR